MAQEPQAADGAIRTVIVDLVVAVLVFLVGALVVYDSNRLGSGWAPDGPQAGYFPFYIGMLICISGVVVGVQAALQLAKDRQVFVLGSQLRQVMVILLPSTVYVLGVQYIGIYISSAVFIGLFMRLVGKYSSLRSAAVGVGVSVVAFLL